MVTKNPTAETLRAASGLVPQGNATEILAAKATMKNNSVYPNTVTGTLNSVPVAKTVTRPSVTTTSKNITVPPILTAIGPVTDASTETLAGYGKRNTSAEGTTASGTSPMVTVKWTKVTKLATPLDDENSAEKPDAHGADRANLAMMKAHHKVATCGEKHTNVNTRDVTGTGLLVYAQSEKPHITNALVFKTR